MVSCSLIGESQPIIANIPGLFIWTELEMMALSRWLLKGLCLCCCYPHLPLGPSLLTRPIEFMLLRKTPIE